MSSQDNTDNKIKNKSSLIKTLLSSGIPHLLGAVSVFFMQEMYRDQKEVEKTQNEIMIILTTIREKQSSIDEKVSSIKGANDLKFSEHLARIESCEDNIMDIWKDKNK